MLKKFLFGFGFVHLCISVMNKMEQVSISLNEIKTANFINDRYRLKLNEIFFSKKLIFLEFQLPPSLFWRNNGSLGLFYKKLRIRNLQKIDRFRSNLASLLLSVTFTGFGQTH